MEINYDELFGLAGEEETEPADPSPEEEERPEEPAGEKEAEVAEPQEKEQSKEENARYAAIRRKAEEEAKAKAQKELDDGIASLGMVDPYSGKPIKTRQEFEAYRNAQSKERKDGVLEKTGWSEDELQSFIDDLPDVKAAKQAKETYERQQQKLALDSQIAELSKLDPSIKTVDDLLKHESYKDVYEYVRRGLSIPEAYKLANFDKLSTERASSAARAAALKSKSTEHLQPTTQRGEGAATVPADVMEYYKALNPTATVAEITAHYNKNHQKG